MWRKIAPVLILFYFSSLRPLWSILPLLPRRTQKLFVALELLFKLKLRIFTSFSAIIVLLSINTLSVYWLLLSVLILSLVEIFLYLYRLLSLLFYSFSLLVSLSYIYFYLLSISNHLPVSLLLNIYILVSSLPWLNLFNPLSASVVFPLLLYGKIVFKFSFY